MFVLDLVNARLQERIDAIQVPARLNGFTRPRSVSASFAQLQTLPVLF
jgi:hypothetical protein